MKTRAAWMLLMIGLLAAPAGELPANAHPRLGFNPQLLGQIAEMRRKHHETWARFEDWINVEKNEHGRYVYTGGEDVSALFGYAVTHDAALFDIAMRTLGPRVWRDPVHPENGLRPFFGKCPEANYCDPHEASTNGAAVISNVALLYDWANDHLTAAQRQDLISWLNTSCEYVQTKNGELFRFRSDGVYTMMAVAAAAYGTEGDNPQAGRLKAWFREDWKQTLRALDIMGRGGAMGEGNAYGEVTGGALIAIANWVWYASGEDLFQTHEWFRKRLAYEAFSTYPNNAPMFPNSPEGAALGGDDSRDGLSWHSLNMRPNGMLLARHFPGTAEANLWNWVFRDPGADAWYELYGYSQQPRAQLPDQLSYFDPSMGYIYVRSDWKSRDATWISFWAGPHLDIHQHLDQGAFTIFKRRDLAVKTGNYDYSVLASHFINYYTRSVSANSLLIGNPDEYFAGFVSFIGCSATDHTLFPVPGKPEQACPANDGGERTAFPRGMVVTSPDEFAANRDAYEYSRVTGFRDTGEVVSWAADITNSYANPRYTATGTKPKVTRVWRRFVYLRPADTLLVADQVTSTNEKFPKSWLLHATDRIDVGGQVKDIAPGESIHSGVRETTLVVDDQSPGNKGALSPDLRSGYAQLHVETLLPREFSYRLTGGREAADTEHISQDSKGIERFHFHRHIRDFWVEDYSAGRLRDHHSANWPPLAPQETVRTDAGPSYFGGYGRWRIAVEPAHPAKDDIFLNVLTPGLKKGDEHPHAEVLEDAQSFGANIHAGKRTWTVRWPKDKLELPEVH